MFYYTPNPRDYYEGYRGQKEPKSNNYQNIKSNNKLCWKKK